MLSQFQHVPQVVSKYLDSRLTHFVSSLGNWMFLLLDDNYPDGRAHLFELQSQRQTSHPSSQNSYIILFSRVKWCLNNCCLFLKVPMVVHLITSCCVQLRPPNVIKPLLIGFVCSSC